MKLTKDWKFALGECRGAEKITFDDRGWRPIQLPHDWCIEGSFQAQRPGYFQKGRNLGESVAYLPGGTAWYRKTWIIPENWKEQNILLEFDGVYMDSDVWLNDHHLGNHPYGYTPFTYDLTPFIRWGAPNTLAVRVKNELINTRWYSGSGIFRNVWLITAAPIRVTHWSTVITSPEITSQMASILVKTSITNDTQIDVPVRVTFHIITAEETTVTTTAYDIIVPAQNAQPLKGELRVPNPILWNLDFPYLYTLRTTVTPTFSNPVHIHEDTIWDQSEEHFGIRKFYFDPRSGFWLNQKNIKIQGTCNHHDLGCLGATFNYRARERQLVLLKAMGCNAIRTSHNPPEPEFLELCDRMGILVMEEAFDEWLVAKRNKGYHRFFYRWWASDLSTMIRRDRNHPCVILWSVGNELHEQGTWWGVYFLKKMKALIQELDPTRPITHGCNHIRGANKTGFADQLDVVGYNYFGVGGFKDPSQIDLDHHQYPQRCMIGSEGSSAVRSRGVYHLPTNRNILRHPDRQCSSYDNSWASWGDPAERAWRAVLERPFFAGDFIWTGFDYLGEPMPYPWPAKSSYFGIFDTCGYPKDIYYFYQSQWRSDIQIVHILPPWTWDADLPADKIIPVWCYTNCEIVELFLNGQSLGEQRIQPPKILHLEWNVSYQPGELKAVGKSNGKITCTDIVHTAKKATRIRLSVDRSLLRATGEDLAFVRVAVEDEEGILVPNASHQVHFELTGPGEIIGVDNGDPTCLESFQGNHRSVFHGLCLVVIQTRDIKGNIQLKATARGLQADDIAIEIS